MNDIFGSRIFLPQRGPFRILQKGHYGLRKRRHKAKLELARTRKVGESGICLFPCLDTQVPGRGLHVAYGHTLGSVPFHRPLMSLRRALTRAPLPTRNFQPHDTLLWSVDPFYCAASWNNNNNNKNLRQSAYSNQRYTAKSHLLRKNLPDRFE